MLTTLTMSQRLMILFADRFCDTSPELDGPAIPSRSFLTLLVVHRSSSWDIGPLYVREPVLLFRQGEGWYA